MGRTSEAEFLGEFDEETIQAVDVAMNMGLTSEAEVSEEFDDETMQAVDVAMSMGLTSEPTNEDFKLIVGSQDSSDEVYTVKHNSSDEYSDLEDVDIGEIYEYIKPEYIKDGKICYDESLNEQKETSSQNLTEENDEDISEEQFLQQQPPEYDEDSKNLLRNDLKEQVCKILKKCGKLSLSFLN